MGSFFASRTAAPRRRSLSQAQKNPSCQSWPVQFLLIIASGHKAPIPRPSIWLSQAWPVLPELRIQRRASPAGGSSTSASVYICQPFVVHPYRPPSSPFSNASYLIARLTPSINIKLVLRGSRPFTCLPPRPPQTAFNVAFTLFNPNPLHQVTSK